MVAITFYINLIFYSIEPHFLFQKKPDILLKLGGIENKWVRYVLVPVQISIIKGFHLDWILNREKVWKMTQFWPIFLVVGFTLQILFNYIFLKIRFLFTFRNLTIFFLRFNKLVHVEFVLLIEEKLHYNDVLHLVHKSTKHLFVIIVQHFLCKIHKLRNFTYFLWVLFEFSSFSIWGPHSEFAKWLLGA